MEDSFDLSHTRSEDHLLAYGLRRVPYSKELFYGQDLTRTAQTGMYIDVDNRLRAIRVVVGPASAVYNNCYAKRLGTNTVQYIMPTWQSRMQPLVSVGDEIDVFVAYADEDCMPCDYENFSVGRCRVDRVDRVDVRGRVLTSLTLARPLPPSQPPSTQQ